MLLLRLLGAACLLVGWVACALAAEASPTGTVSARSFPDTDSKEVWIVSKGRRESCQEGVWSIRDGRYLATFAPPPRGASILGEGYVSRANSTIGWDELMVSAESDVSPEDNHYFIGFMEGVLTHEAIGRLTKNARSLREQGETLDVTLKYLKTWFTGVENKATELLKHASFATSEDGLFWSEVRLTTIRYRGLVDALNHPCLSPSERVPEDDVLLMQHDGDVLDIEQAVMLKLRQSSAFSLRSQSSVEALARARRVNLALTGGRSRAEANDERLWQDLQAGSKCSALIKVEGDDVLMGHNAWASYAEMVRVYKHVSVAGRASVSYASYAGMLSSSDDWYTTSYGLFITETSLNVIDAASYHGMLDKISDAPKKLGGVPTWMRTAVAAAVSRSGAQFARLMGKESGIGTYNCQWMILDQKKLDWLSLTQEDHALRARLLNRLRDALQSGNGTRLLSPERGEEDDVPGLFMVFETMPGGFHHGEDMSHRLKSNGYFSSQNTPFFPSTRAAGLYPDPPTRRPCKPCACHYSYDDNPRGCAFKRDAPNVHSMSDLAQLLRTCSYKSDPLALGKPHNVISARYDLLPKTDPLRSPTGAIDAKVASLRTGEVWLVGGPTITEECPRVDESEAWTDPSVRHEGVSFQAGNVWVKIHGYHYL